MAATGGGQCREPPHGLLLLPIRLLASSKLQIACVYWRQADTYSVKLEDLSARGEPRATGRILGAIFLGSSFVTVVAILFPHSSKADVDAFWALAAVMAVIAVLLLGWYEWLPAWSYQAFAASASVLVALSLYFNGERRGGPAALNEVYYLWVGLCCGYLFTRRQVVVQLVFLAATYAVALIAIHSGPVGYTRWFITVGMVAGATTIVHVLKRHNDGLVDRLAHAARADGLTGLLNRQGFDDRFEFELERTLRTGQPLALVLGDLDRLKSINDRWGHPAGDAALAEVGRLLREAVRKIDAVARIGGDEFALLLPDADAQAALEVTERVRTTAASVIIGNGEPLTLSFGIVEFPQDGATREALVHEADQALYRAKALRRIRADDAVVPSAG